MIMVEKLYYADPYLREFDATIADIKGDRIFLDRTAFYPGGGGQAADLGTIDGNNVTEVGKDGDEIFHVVLGTSFGKGQEVKCALDWDRRYELMRGHSGQHILFRAMQEQNPELGVGKVDIGIDKKVLLFNGRISWDDLRRALAKTNEVIASDLDVLIQEVPKDSPDLADVRIKADRIVGDKVRIIRIGDFDAAACGGVHVRHTGEIGGLSIVKMVSGRQASDWSVQFEVGFKALQSSSDLAISTLSIADVLGCATGNVEPTVSNLKDKAESLSEKLRTASQVQLDALQPEKVCNFSVFSAILSGADRKTMNDVSSKLIRQDGAIILLCDVSDNAFMVVACNEKIRLDCPALLKKGLDMMNGRGGGKKNFAQGGGTDKTKAELAFKAVRQSILDILTSEFSCG
jgi:alanyl-tRNA synthetase